MLSLIIIFLLITLAGFVVVRTIIKEQDSFILLPVSQIIGVTSYIFLLNVISKIVQGKTGIIISTVTLIAFTIFIYLKYKSDWVKLNPLRGKSKLLFFFIIFVILILSSLKMFTMLPAADATMQWAYAASFARGNYPLMTPWQPDLAPNYHLGAYFFEGALFSLTGSLFVLIHTIFNIFLLFSGSLLVIFLLWKRGPFAKPWSIFAVLLFFIAYGVIIVAFPNFSQTQPIGLSELREAIPAKGEAEASLVNLNALSFLPARSLSLSIALVILYFIKTPFRKNFLKILTLSLLLSITALIEESMFIPLMLVLISIFIISLFSLIPKIAYVANYRKSLLMIIILTATIVISQGGFITDNLFRVKRETAAFRILNPFSDYFYAQRVKLSMKLFTDLPIKSNLPVPFSGWLIPSPLWFILILLIYSYIKKDSLTGCIALFSIIAFALFLGTEYKYCSGCSIRIHSFGNIALGFGIFYIIIDLLKNSSRKTNLIALFLFAIFVLIPSITADVLYQNQLINKGLQDKLATIILSNNDPSPKNAIAKWAKDNIPANERIIVVDTEFPSPAGSLGFQFYGLHTILGPQYIRVNRQEPGVEFFDLALTLNPSLFAKTNTKYVYIESDSIAYKQLPQIRKDDLNNSNFFKVLRFIENNNSSYRLLRVLPLYSDAKLGGKEINEGRLDQLGSLIPGDASVYLSDYGSPPKFLNFWYRMPFAYYLGDGNHDLVMNIPQTTYQVIEMVLKRRMVKEGAIYDYYILSSTEKPDFQAKLIWSNIFASVWKRI